jgi:hypothetical protein
VDDLKQIEKKQVDLRRVSDNEIDYSNLANQIRKSRRGDSPPRITGVSMSLDHDRNRCLIVTGDNLAVDPAFEPVAVVNQRLADVLQSSDSELRIRLDPRHRFRDDNEVVMTFDPFAVVKVNVRA